MEQSSIESEVVYDVPAVSAMEHAHEQLQQVDISWQLINR